MHLECFNMFEDSHSREHVWSPAFFSVLYGSEASESFPRPTFTMNSETPHVSQVAKKTTH